MYIVEVNKIDESYIVSATWGRRLAPRLSSQIKAELSRESSALACAINLIEAKKRGKDNYLKAVETLIIPGFKKQKISAAQVHAASKVSSNATITSNEVPVTRKIRL